MENVYLLMSSRIGSSCLVRVPTMKNSAGIDANPMRDFDCVVSRKKIDPKQIKNKQDDGKTQETENYDHVCGQYNGIHTVLLRTSYLTKCFHSNSLLWG